MDPSDSEVPLTRVVQRQGTYLSTAPPSPATEVHYFQSPSGASRAVSMHHAAGEVINERSGVVSLHCAITFGSWTRVPQALSEIRGDCIDARTRQLGVYIWTLI